jgi:hypothetical protein
MHEDRGDPIITFASLADLLNTGKKGEDVQEKVSTSRPSSSMRQSDQVIGDHGFYISPFLDKLNDVLGVRGVVKLQMAW